MVIKQQKDNKIFESGLIYLIFVKYQHPFQSAQSLPITKKVQLRHIATCTWYNLVWSTTNKTDKSVEIQSRLRTLHRLIWKLRVGFWKVFRGQFYIITLWCDYRYWTPLSTISVLFWLSVLLLNETAILGENQRPSNYWHTLSHGFSVLLQERQVRHHALRFTEKQLLPSGV